jgi:uncharacterized caspase-like protein
MLILTVTDTALAQHMKLIVRIFLAVLVILAGAAAPARANNNGSPRPGAVNDGLHKVALVIGNSAYVNAARLPNSVNDANDVCAALKKLQFDVICKTNIVSKREFKDAIYEFTGRINEKTVALFYFAGHGLQIDGLNYLIPTQAALKTKSDIEDESIQINYLMSELEARRAALNIFMLDACRDNPFISPIRGYAPTLGLASQLYAPRNSIVAMSTGAGQLSLDGTGRNGTFTKNLLEFMHTPRQSVEDMLKAVSGGTSADAKRLGRQQDPQITTSYADKYCMAGCGDKDFAVADEQIKAKTLELDRLQLTITQTRNKQLELEQQKDALLKKQSEIDKLKTDIGNAQSRNQEMDKQNRELALKREELAGINAKINSSVATLNELETIKSALLKKQEELNKMREMLSIQQATIDEKNKEIRTRAIENPDKAKPQLMIVPAF